MSEIVNKIKYAMSLRTPQAEALSYLDAISSHCDYKKDSKEVDKRIISINYFKDEIPIDENVNTPCENNQGIEVLTKIIYCAIILDKRKSGDIYKSR